MRLTSRKKAILDLFSPDMAEIVRFKVGDPPFDVVGVCRMIIGFGDLKPSDLWSVRRTLNQMVDDGLLEKAEFVERRINKTQGWSDAPGVVCSVFRYGLKGQMTQVRRYKRRDDEQFIEGEYSVLQDDANTAF